MTYVASYLDSIGRSVASADYGTNGGAALSGSSTIPSRSDTVLVSSTAFDSAGNVLQTTDPAGLVTRNESSFPESASHFVFLVTTTSDRLRQTTHEPGRTRQPPTWSHIWGRVYKFQNWLLAGFDWVDNLRANFEICTPDPCRCSPRRTHQYRRSIPIPCAPFQASKKGTSLQQELGR